MLECTVFSNSCITSILAHSLATERYWRIPTGEMPTETYVWSPLPWQHSSSQAISHIEKKGWAVERGYLSGSIVAVSLHRCSMGVCYNWSSVTPTSGCSILPGIPVPVATAHTHTTREGNTCNFPLHNRSLPARIHTSLTVDKTVGQAIESQL